MNKVNFQTINNDLLVELPIISKKTDAGLIKSKAMIKEEESKSDSFYLVLRVGTECKFIKEGDKIYINGKHPRIELDGTLYAIVNEIHVLGKRVN